LYIGLGVLCGFALYQKHIILTEVASHASSSREYIQLSKSPIHDPLYPSIPSSLRHINFIYLHNVFHSIPIQWSALNLTSTLRYGLEFHSLHILANDVPTHTEANGRRDTICKEKKIK
jgi:hypothetical protein